MNKQETAEAIKVMQAYVDGEEIEFQQDDESWFVCTPRDPQWEWDARAYRIKPKPREFILYPSKTAKSGFKVKADNEGEDKYLGTFKVREVL